MSYQLSRISFWLAGVVAALAWILPRGHETVLTGLVLCASLMALVARQKTVHEVHWPVALAVPVLPHARPVARIESIGFAPVVEPVALANLLALIAANCAERSVFGQFGTPIEDIDTANGPRVDDNVLQPKRTARMLRSEGYRGDLASGMLEGARAVPPIDRWSASAHGRAARR